MSNIWVMKLNAFYLQYGPTENLVSMSGVNGIQAYMKICKQSHFFSGFCIYKLGGT